MGRRHFLLQFFLAVAVLCLMLSGNVVYAINGDAAQTPDTTRYAGDPSDGCGGGGGCGGSSGSDSDDTKPAETTPATTEPPKPAAQQPDPSTPQYIPPPPYDPSRVKTNTMETTVEGSEDSSSQSSGGDCNN